MIVSAARFRALSAHPNWRWAAVALITGVGAALLPPALSLLIIAGLVLTTIGLAQPIAPLLATLIIAPLKALIDTESATLLDPGQIMLAATAALWFVNRVVTRRSIVRGSIVYVPIGLIVISASFSLFVAIAPVTTLIELSKWIEMVGVAALIVTTVAENGPGWPVVGLFAAASIEAALGLYQFFGGSGAPSLWILDNRYFRAFGTFGQPNPFGAFMGLTLPLVIGLMIGLVSPHPFSLMKRGAKAPPPLRVRRGGWGVRLIALIACAILLFAALIASWSRGSWLGFGAALFVMLIFMPRRRLIGIGLAGALTAIGVGLLASGLLPASLTARLGDFSGELSGFQDVRGQVITDANYAVLERLAHWQAGLAMAEAHPWLGVGFGNYEAAYPQYGLMNWKFPLGHAHNYFINVLAETGIVGLIGYAVAWIIIVVLTICLLDRTHGAERGLALGALGTWTYLAVHSVFDKLYVDNLFLHVGAILGLIGGLLLLSRYENRAITGYED